MFDVTSNDEISKYILMFDEYSGPKVLSHGVMNPPCEVSMKRIRNIKRGLVMYLMQFEYNFYSTLVLNIMLNKDEVTINKIIDELIIDLKNAFTDKEVETHFTKYKLDGTRLISAEFFTFLIDKSAKGEYRFLKKLLKEHGNQQSLGDERFYKIDISDYFDKYASDILYKNLYKIVDDEYDFYFFNIVTDYLNQIPNEGEKMIVKRLNPLFKYGYESYAKAEKVNKFITENHDILIEDFRKARF